MTEGFSEAEAWALDRFAPPPLKAGFADRVSARLSVEGLPPLPRGSARGRWQRGRIALVAGVGGALLSVGAAASGLLGVTVQNMPVITTIASAVDAPRAKPVPVVREQAALKRPAPVDPKPDAAVAPVAPAASPDALRLADRIEARMKRRDALGLSVPSLARLEARRDAMAARGDPRAETMAAALTVLKARADAGALPPPRTQRAADRAQWRARMAALSPEEHAAIEARREWRRQQQLAAAADPSAEPGAVKPQATEPAPVRERFRDRWANMTPEERAEWRARRAAREALLTPEQRQALEQRREQRREERRRQMLRGPEGLTGGPEPAPPETAAPQ